jgi:anthranilate synthase component 1
MVKTADISINVRPSLDEVRAAASRGNLVPVYREINADLETPVSAYLKVARPPYSFLLESVEGGERVARYSFIGTDPFEVIKTGPGQKDGAVDPLTVVQKALSRYKVVEQPGAVRFDGGAVGYLSYEAARYFERLPSPDKDPVAVPEAVFMLCDTFLIFDHVRHKIRVVSHAHLDGDAEGPASPSRSSIGVEKAYRDAAARIDGVVRRLGEPLRMPHRTGGAASNAQFKSNMARAHYDKALRRIGEYIYAGDCIQVVFSQRFSRKTSAHPLEVYRALRGINPSPYMYYLDLGEFQIVGASPEMLVRCVDGKLEYHPIAGTRPRGATPKEDAALAEELLADKKERAEHIMLVDLGRNDVGRVSKPGTVKVTQLMDIERYSHVMHIVSHVTGELSDGLTCYDALRSCFPAGTVSGAPKIRAMEIIAELEPEKRGPYSGAVGYFSFSGNMDTCIALRTMVMKDGVAYLQAGGGIVADSKADAEYQETVNKASALVRAVEQAEKGE